MLQIVFNYLFKKYHRQKKYTVILIIFKNKNIYEISGFFKINFVFLLFLFYKKKLRYITGIFSKDFNNHFIPC